MYEKRETQREKLVHAACELAAERGVAALRTRDIAALAGVSVGTLHYCFATKEELLRALYAYLRAEFRTTLEGILYGEGIPTETLNATTQARIHLLRNPTHAFRAWRAFCREAWTNETVGSIVREHFAEQRARFEAMLLRARDAGVAAGLASENPTMGGIAILTSLYEGMIVQWTIDPASFDLDAYSSAINALIGASADSVKDDSDHEKQAARRSETTR